MNSSTSTTTSATHDHAAVGRGIPCDYTGTAALDGDDAYDVCEICMCGSLRYSPSVSGDLETLGAWDVPKAQDAELLALIMASALSADAAQATT